MLEPLPAIYDRPSMFPKTISDLVWKYRIIHELRFLASHMFSNSFPVEIRDISSRESALHGFFCFIAFTSSLLIMKIPITMVMKKGIKRCMQAVSDAFVCFMGEPGYRRLGFKGLLLAVFTKERWTTCVNGSIDNLMQITHTKMKIPVQELVHGDNV